MYLAFLWLYQHFQFRIKGLQEIIFNTIEVASFFYFQEEAAQ